MAGRQIGTFPRTRIKQTHNSTHTRTKTGGGRWNHQKNSTAGKEYAVHCVMKKNNTHTHICPDIARVLTYRETVGVRDDVQ